MRRIEVYRTFSVRRMRREFNWRFVHANGNVMATGGNQGYVRIVDCLDAIETVAAEMQDALIVKGDEYAG